MRLAIVIPTYNERENIKRLILKILKLNIDLEIIVVDDNSPDQTFNVVQDLKNAYGHIHLICRKQDPGRGFAGVAGFKYALSLDVHYIMEMDADLSHDPVFIPNFLETIKYADVVIGSRFVKGSKDERRNILRRIISIFANFYLRVTLRVPVRDCTSGYRCFKREVLAAIDLDSLHSPGPSIVEEILYRCKRFTIREIPIRFMDRPAGISKLSLKKLLYCLMIPWLVHRK
ncbi:MAG: polyprenol monophosphomannose synthase [Candidatus Omnitrophota bacterium]